MDGYSWKTFQLKSFVLRGDDVLTGNMLSEILVLRVQRTFEKGGGVIPFDMFTMY